MLQKLWVAGIAAVAIAGGIYTLHLQKQVAALQEQQALLNRYLAQLSRERDDATHQLAAAQREIEQRQNNQAELLRLRGETGVLRRQLAEANKTNRALPGMAAVMKTNAPIPQIVLEASFLTMPKAASAGWSDPTSAGILTSENLSIALEQLRTRQDVETLAKPKVLTLSGRQVQIRATRTISVVTNYGLQETDGVSSVVPQTAAVECGPTLDATPQVLPDGYTIRLPIIASVIEFLGYAPLGNTPAAQLSAGQATPVVSPQFRMQQRTNSVDMLDGQTLVLRLNDLQTPAATAPAATDGDAASSPDRDTLVFITATLVDAAGNRVHETPGHDAQVPPRPVGQ